MLRTRAYFSSTITIFVWERKRIFSSLTDSRVCQHKHNNSSTNSLMVQWTVHINNFINLGKLSDTHIHLLMFAYKLFSRMFAFPSACFFHVDNCRHVRHMRLCVSPRDLRQTTLPAAPVGLCDSCQSSCDLAYRPIQLTTRYQYFFYIGYHSIV